MTIKPFKRNINGCFHDIGHENNINNLNENI